MLAVWLVLCSAMCVVGDIGAPMEEAPSYEAGGTYQQDYCVNNVGPGSKVVGYFPYSQRISVENCDAYCKTKKAISDTLEGLLYQRGKCMYVSSVSSIALAEDCLPSQSCVCKLCKYCELCPASANPCDEGVLGEQLAVVNYPACTPVEINPN